MSERPSSQKAERAAPGDDRQTVVLGLVAFFLAAMLIAGIAYVFAAGLLGNGAPRTAAERDLNASRAGIVADSSDVVAYASYAEVLVANGQYSSAAEILAAGEAIDSEDPALLLARARLHRALGETEEALATLGRATQVVLAGRADMDASLQERGISGDFELPGTALLVRSAMLEAEIRGEQGDVEGVIEALTRALEASPSMSDVLVARGDAYASLGRDEEARADYKLALQFVPDLPDALLGIEELGGGGQ